jgi:hypothetical protein
MIPGPFPTSDCFLTDQRDFSSAVNAKSRMHCEARIDLRSPAPTMTEYHNCDWTTECDCEDGDEECKKKGGTGGMKYTLRPGTKGKGVEIVTRRPPKSNTVMDLPGAASTRVESYELYDPGSGRFVQRITAGAPRFDPLASRITLHEGGSAS